DRDSQEATAADHTVRCVVGCWTISCWFFVPGHHKPPSSSVPRSIALNPLPETDHELVHAAPFIHCEACASSLSDKLNCHQPFASFGSYPSPTSWHNERLPSEAR